MAVVKELDQQRIVRVVFIALLIDLFAFTIILPLFPRLLNYYQSQELKDQVKKRHEKKKKKEKVLSKYIEFCTWLRFSRIGIL